MQNADRLDGVHPILEDILDTVDEILRDIYGRELRILQGARTEAEHNKYLASGATTIPYTATAHNPNRYPDGLARAADIVVLRPDGTFTKEDWGDFHKRQTLAGRDRAWQARVPFYVVGALARAAARDYGVRVRFGGDWDGDGDYTDQTFNDLVHLELEGV